MQRIDQMSQVPIRDHGFLAKYQAASRLVTETGPKTAFKHFLVLGLDLGFLKTVLGAFAFIVGRHRAYRTPLEGGDGGILGQGALH